MHLNWIALCVPLFLVFIALEYYVSTRRNQQFFRFAESIANLNVGIGERVTDLLTAGIFYFVFDYIYDHYALFTFPQTVWTWILLFLPTDFLWYWYHRLAHRINLFWAAHIVHHQSEDFNYTVSTRITIFQAIIRSLFWSVMPLLGFAPDMIFLLLLFHGAYPFFTHTQTIGKLGWLEYIIVTPSHHRVHHASNPQYLDKNFGDVLIIWDKIFGTFVAEKEKPVYGLVHPLKSYSFLWQHFHGLLELIVASGRTRGINKKLSIFFGKPEDIDPAIRPTLEKKWLSRSVANPTSLLHKYVFWQTALNLLVLFFVLLLEHYLSGLQLFLAAAFILVSVINTSAILEQRKWVLNLEYVRLALLLLFINDYYYSIYLFALLALVGVIILWYNRSIRSLYFQSLYNLELSSDPDRRYSSTDSNKLV